MTKTANKHNRLFGNAEPLSINLVEEIDKGHISAKMDHKERSQILVKDF